MKKRRILPVIFAAVVVVMMMNIMICVLSVRVEATVPGGIKSDGIYALQNKGTGKYLDIQKDWIEDFFVQLNKKKEGTERFLTAYEAFSIVNASTYNSSNSADICGTDTSFSFN